MANNVEELFLWSCTLDTENKEYNWSPEDPADMDDILDVTDPSVKPTHRLLLKTAILMPSAKDGQVNIVQIESEGYNKKIVLPVCAMKGGVDLQTYMDFLVPYPAKFTLIQGEGPIFMVGSHCVDFSGYRFS